MQAHMFFGFGKEVTSLTWKDGDTTYWYHQKTKVHMPVITYVVGGLLTLAGVVFSIPTSGGSLVLSKIGLAMIAGSTASDFIVQEISERVTGGSVYKVDIEPHETVNISIAYSLKKSVATYYKALMEVALVGLLLAIVYVSIRMLTSTVSQDKAKYKKMLGDCITAICILFFLHFFINCVLKVIQSINNVFSGTVIENGKDVLMSTLRTEIGHDPNNRDLSASFAKIVIYLVLVIYTIQFTVVYLKRVINMAFLTIIAPLVAFTYPLDKVKDGQAQGLNIWLKEFSFNALMQPIHMILYWIFVGGSIGFATQNPIYALVMIGFLKPGEKYVRQLFGLESESSLGKMTSALGGAAIMNAINKIGSKGGPKGKKGAGGGETAGGEGTSKTRMANSGTDPYEALRGGNGANGASAGNAGGNSGGNAGSGTTTTGGANSTATATTAQTATGASTASTAPTLQNRATTKKGRFKKVARGIGSAARGVGSVARKYGKNAIRGVGKVTGAAALGTIGLAAGIATGDMSNAIAGLTGGMAAGSRLGGNVVDGMYKLPGAANGIRRDVVDTFREGAYGKDEAARIRFDKTFKRSEGYKNLIKAHPGTEKQVDEFLAAGITDTSKMGKAMDSGYSTGEAIAYMKMADSKDCPDEVLYDKDKFKTYLETNRIDSSRAEEIRRGIVTFK